VDLVCLLLLCYLCIISDNFVSAESECPQKLPHVVLNCSAEDDMKSDDGSAAMRNVVASCVTRILSTQAEGILELSGFIDEDHSGDSLEVHHLRPAPAHRPAAYGGDW
jgi:hypothetical protein